MPQLRSWEMGWVGLELEVVLESELYALSVKSGTGIGSRCCEDELGCGLL
jgi:hypothetical protein